MMDMCGRPCSLLIPRTPYATRASVRPPAGLAYRNSADEGTTLSVADLTALFRVLDGAPAVRHQWDGSVLGAA